MKPIFIEPIHNPWMLCMDTQMERGEEGWICISVALLPHYENVGSALGNKSDNIQDVWLNSSLESLSLLEEMSEDCELEI